jgi:transposase-like protein
MTAQQRRRLRHLLRATEHEVPSYMAFPRAHWLQIHSTDPLERLNAEIKRLTHVVGVFPRRRVHHAPGWRHAAGAKRRVEPEPALDAA